ncbi:GDSL-type esterase/lipase family protein [Streptomyces sp. NPDC015346]|uniref:SGNH/GDSL hydrolase family protein n=1 Tax=Streptomyces sp. NPDC015346 TaxID=3364954 RepID=UPI0036FF3121
MTQPPATPVRTPVGPLAEPAGIRDGAPMTQPPATPVRTPVRPPAEPAGIRDGGAWAVPRPARRVMGPDRPRSGNRPLQPLRFAVLGDSLSEGVGDRVEGAWRGWAALLADGLVEAGRAVEVRNLAVSGAQSREVAEEQAPEAVAFRPDLASVVVGVNDTLRRTFDIERFARCLDRVCADLAGNGAVLLTACLPDPGRMLRLPTPLARPLERRQKAVNALVHAVSARYDAVHLHLAEPVWTDDRSLWSADRLHPGERGHRAIAARFHTLLAARGLAHGTPPSPEPEQPPPTRADTVRWLATAGTGWVARRCHDLLPQLLHLAGAELRHSAAGTAARLDHRAEHALSAALAAVSLDAPVATMGE